MLLIGDLSELQEKDYGDKARLSRPPSVSSFTESDTGNFYFYSILTDCYNHYNEF